MALTRKLADGALVVFLVSCPETPYKLTEEDVVLFRHPKVKYIRLSGVDISVFERVRASEVRHEQLSILSIDGTKYTNKAIQRLVMPSTSLKKVTLFDTYSLVLPYSIYSALLTYSAATLKNLTLLWMGCYHNDEEAGKVLDLSSFKALRLLAINPAYLLGRDFRANGDQETRDAAQLIARRLPPNIKVLILEALILPYPSPFQTADVEMIQVFPNKAEVLIQVLIEQKMVHTPGLKYVWVDCGHGDTSIPPWLFDMGDVHDVSLGLVNGFELASGKTPPMEWLDEP